MQCSSDCSLLHSTCSTPLWEGERDVWTTKTDASPAQFKWLLHFDITFYHFSVCVRECVCMHRPSSLLPPLREFAFHLFVPFKNVSRSQAMQTQMPKIHLRRLDVAYMYGVRLSESPENPFLPSKKGLIHSKQLNSSKKMRSEKQKEG